jgi:aryl carrier-like protein
MSSEYQAGQVPSGRVIDAAQARAGLRAWILRKNDDVDPQELSDQTPLLAAGYLRSIHLPELILMLERWRGAHIDVANLRPGDFHDIAAIVSNFVIGTHDSGVIP